MLTPQALAAATNELLTVMMQLSPSQIGAYTLYDMTFKVLSYLHLFAVTRFDKVCQHIAIHSFKKHLDSTRLIINNTGPQKRCTAAWLSAPTLKLQLITKQLA